MSKLSYIKPLKNGGMIIDIARLPDTVFLDAHKVVAIYTARLIGNSERAKYNISAGAPDVLMQSATGGKRFITRQELITNYTHSSGKKIKLMFLKNNTPYVVINNTSEQYKIFKLPSNAYGMLNEKRKSECKTCIY